LDGLSYLAKMRIGFDGGWLFHLLFTPEQGQGVFLFTYFIALGHLARILGLPLIVVFHAVRLLGGFALLWMIYELIARVTDGIDLRRRAWWIVALSSGMGWLAALLGHGDSADMTIPESNTFYMLIANAHFALAAAIMIGMFILILEMRSFSIGKIIILTILSLILAIIQPFAPVAVYGIAGVALLVLWWRDRRFPRRQFSAAFVAGLITVPLLIYLYSATQADAVLRAWSQQNQTPSPPPIDYVLGYGLLWIFAFFGVRQAWRRKSDWDILLLAWIIVTLPLLYAPFPLQRRLSLGLHVPIGILAAIGLTEIVRTKWPRRALIGVTLLTSVFIELALFGGAATRDPRIYLTTNEAAALTWLQANAAHDAVVLASPEMGGFIPAFAGQRVIYGHPYETVDANTREEQVRSFYADTLDQTQFLNEHAVTYIIAGPRERKLGAFDAAQLPLEEVFSSGDVTIYQVKRNP
ncbi:MAG TPA: hypothetical protein VMP08_01160, partial [Anaerolineae bacterium]|nr:hypothetical protein [Anaerolineae bacterium]